jgi:hypothetical protein
LYESTVLFIISNYLGSGEASLTLADDEPNEKVLVERRDGRSRERLSWIISPRPTCSGANARACTHPRIGAQLALTRGACEVPRGDARRSRRCSRELRYRVTVRERSPLNNNTLACHAYF